MFLVFFGDADALVPDAGGDVLAILLQLEKNGAVVAGIFNGVGQEVDKNILKYFFVQVSFQVAALEVRLYFLARFEQALHFFDDFFSQFLDGKVDRIDLYLAFLLFAER